MADIQELKRQIVNYGRANFHRDEDAAEAAYTALSGIIAQLEQANGGHEHEGKSAESRANASSLGGRGIAPPAGEMPDLPEPNSYCTHADSHEYDVFDAKQMHDYARQYASRLAQTPMDVTVYTLEKLRAALTRFGVSCGEGGLENFSVKFESHLLEFIRAATDTLDKLRQAYAELEASQLALPAGPVPFKKASLTDTSTPLAYSNNCADAVKSTSAQCPQDDKPACAACLGIGACHANGELLDVSPAVAQPVADEREAFQEWIKAKKLLASEPMWIAWQARAALSAPPAEEKDSPVFAIPCRKYQFSTGSVPACPSNCKCDQQAAPFAEAERKDAERYRWLRQCGPKFDQLPILDGGGNIDAQALDEAIDAAMAKEKP